MTELSVIIPCCNEYPQVIFTIRNIAEELLGRVDFEIIVVDNSGCEESKKQVLDPSLKAFWSKDTEVIKASERGHPWLKYVEYSSSLSHWQAKNMGVSKSSGKVLWFCDAHCIIGRDSLYNMFKTYTNYDLGFSEKGTFHLPLTYKILEWHKTMYKLVTIPEKGVYDYSLTPYRPTMKGGEETLTEVPAVSSCGMMMSKKIYNELGGWPKSLGIYSGGEHFINFTMATIGYKKWIHPGILCHHGEKRGYHYVYDNFIRNKILATYIFGGQKIATTFIEHLIDINKGKPQVLYSMLEDVIKKEGNHRNSIKGKQIISIDEWTNTQ